MWRAGVQTLGYWLKQKIEQSSLKSALALFFVGLIGSLVVSRHFSPSFQAMLDALAWGLAGLILGLLIGPFSRMIRSVWRISRATDLIESPELWLLYEKGLPDSPNALKEMALRALREAEQFLGTPLQIRTRPGVAMIRSDTLRTAFQNHPRFGGLASEEIYTIMVVYDDSPEHNYRVMKHEWTHLITFQWFRDAPALFKEGIAQATKFSDAPDELHQEAIFYLHYFPTRSLIDLLQAQVMYDEQWRYACYAWAGSFVMYLIQQHGLERFRDFYISLRERAVDEAFQAVYGCSLAQVEMEWRRYLLGRCNEPSMAAKVREGLIQRLERALLRNDLFALRLYAEHAAHTYPDEWLAHFALGYCAYWEYDLERALHHYERAACCPEPEKIPLRGFTWLRHGQLCDLLGMRDRAIECYQTALQYPDFEEPDSYHRYAQRYLQIPFTWQERFQLLAQSVPSATT